MEQNPIQNDARRAARAQYLGDVRRCTMCGEADLFALRKGSASLLEEHHVVGRTHDPDWTITLCFNCHRKLTERMRAAGAAMTSAASCLEREAAVMLALSAFYRMQGEKLDRPAVARITLTSPDQLERLQHAWRADADYCSQLKPFNFALSVQVEPPGYPEGADPERFHLLAPYQTDARQWLAMDWTDVYSGTQWRIATGPDVPYWKVRVKSFRDVLERYATHPEPKSEAASGSPCDRETVGLLRRRSVRCDEPFVVGKESNRVGDVQLGLVHKWDDVQPVY